jgi:hypothetical protein
MIEGDKILLGSDVDKRQGFRAIAMITIGVYAVRYHIADHPITHLFFETRRQVL